MSKTFKVQYVQDGVLKKEPSASRTFLSVLLKWIKSGVITELEIKTKTMSNLFQIQQEYLVLNEIIQQAEGEITEETANALAINKAELEVKAQGYGYVIKKNEAEIMIIDQEIKRLQDLKARRNRATDTLKEYISAAMDLYEVPVIETPLIKLSFRKSTAVEITDMEKIPTELIVVSVSRTPDKINIKKAINDGLNVPGAELVERKSLQIK